MKKLGLSSSELKRLEDICSNLRDQLLMRFIFKIDCTISDTLLVKTRDVDFVNGNITIIHLKRRIRLSCSTCGAKLRINDLYCHNCGTKNVNTKAEDQEYRCQKTLPVDRKTLELLKEYIDRGGPVEKDGKQFIIGIGRHRAWQILKVSIKKAGLA